MAFIKNKQHKVGDWVITQHEHESCAGKFTAGSRVQIIEIDPVRGYAIQDKHGNRIIECGWDL